MRKRVLLPVSWSSYSSTISQDRFPQASRSWSSWLTVFWPLSRGPDAGVEGGFYAYALCVDDSRDISPKHPRRAASRKGSKCVQQGEPDHSFRW